MSIDPILLEGLSIDFLGTVFQGPPGKNGRNVEIQKTTSYIQWRYVGDNTWTNLIAIAEITGPRGFDGVDGNDGEKGEDGLPGKSIELQTSATHIQWRYVGDTSWIDLVSLADLKGDPGADGTDGTDGEDGKNVEFQANSSHIQWRVVGDTTWTNLIALSAITGPAGTGLKNRGAWAASTLYSPGDYVFSTGSATSSSMWILKGDEDYLSNTLPMNDLDNWVEFVAPTGEDGREVELQTNATHIQWRYAGEPSWTNLVALSSLKGEPGQDGTDGIDGTDGAPVELQKTSTHIQWRNVGDSFWIDLVALADLKGADGTDGTNGEDGADGKNIELQKSVTHVQWRNVGDSTWIDLIPLTDLTGPAGADGQDGADGTGVPTGGTTGQVLAKASGTDGDVEWIDPPEGGGSDLPALTGNAGKILAVNSNADGTEWITAPSGGGGGGGLPNVIALRTDQYVNQTLVPGNIVSIAVEANKVYEFEAYILAQPSAKTTGYKFSFDISIGVRTISMQATYIGEDGELHGTQLTDFMDVLTVPNWQTSNRHNVVKISGIIESIDGGYVTLQGSVATEWDYVAILRGTCIKLTKMN